jgi:phosphatidylinositol-3-phosphatase
MRVFRIVLFISLLVLASLAGRKARASSTNLPVINTVFIILEENHDWVDITASVAPFIRNSLLPMGSHAEQYFNPPGNHPSEPNYLWLEAGTNFGITNDDPPGVNHQSTTSHLVTLLKNANISWKAYEEDIDGTSCPLSSVNNYVPAHDPFVFFDDVTNANDPTSAYCIAHVRPFSELATDLQTNAVARYNFITPSLLDDMHTGTITEGDTWLAKNVPMILASQAFQNGGALFITWDEGDGSTSDGPIGMIVLSPSAKTNFSNTIHYTHSSTLRTMEEIFNVSPLLGDAANATDLSDFFLVTPRPDVLLSHRTLDFGDQPQGTSSQPFLVTVNNVGNRDLIIASNGISISGMNAADFMVANTSTCAPGATIIAGSSCQLDLVFTPSTGASESAELDISDNAFGSPQSVALVGMGTATSFSLSTGGSPTSITIDAGDPAKYSLQVAALKGFSGTVTVGCSGAPVAATCVASPGSVALSGTAPVPFSVDVTTTARSEAAPPSELRRVRPLGSVRRELLLILALATLAILAKRRARLLYMTPALTLVLLALLAAGCGGSSSSAPPPPSSGTPAGTYALTVTASSGSQTDTLSLTLNVK